MKLLAATPYQIVKAGLIVGFFDGLAACLNAFFRSHVTPDGVFRFIASGVFGKEAYSDGSLMIGFGIVFHFIIAVSWTLLYFVLAADLDLLHRRFVISGIFYGVFIWVVMNFAILPLSRVPDLPFNWPSASIMMAIHIFIIGIPIAYFAQKYQR